MGVFETVDFRLVRDEGRNVLVIDARPKSWGPTFLRVGSGFEANFDGDATLALRATLHAMQLNARGGELKTTSSSARSRASTSSTTSRSTSGAGSSSAPTSLYQRSLARVSVPGGPVGEARVSVLQGSVDGGVSLGSFGQIHAGVFRGTGGGEHPPGGDAAGGPELRPRGSLRLRRRTTRSTTSASRAGGRSPPARLEAFLDGMGSDSTFYRFFARGIQALPLGPRTAVLASAGWEDTLGSDPPYYMLFTLADFNRFSALSREIVAGERAASLSASLSHRIASLPTRLGRGVYVGGTFELARVWTRREETSLSGLRPAGGVYAGADTVLGPIYAGVGVGYGGNTTLLRLPRPAVLNGEGRDELPAPFR